MEELFKEFHTLEEKIRKLLYSWRIVTASQYTEEDWKQEHKKYNMLLKEIKEVSEKILPSLYKERADLKKKYFLFPKSLIYIILFKEKKIAINRYNQLCREIKKLEDYLFKDFE